MYRLNGSNKKIRCQMCGEEIVQTSPHQKYCDGCRNEANNAKRREKWKEKKTTALPASNKYDFAKITKYCAEHHITYGEAQKLGLLDNARFYRK